MGITQAWAHKSDIEPEKLRRDGHILVSSNTFLRGFTLVELLIVVILLGILAAVVVPQFSAATNDTKLASLDTTLANMRAAIDVYYQQHGKYPGKKESKDSDTCGPVLGGIPGTGDDKTEQAFIDQMSRYTNRKGESCTKTDSEFKYGPYLRTDLLPANPQTGSNALLISTAGALDMNSAVTNGGWKYDTGTGHFIADHTDYDER